MRIIDPVSLLTLIEVAIERKPKMHQEKKTKNWER